MRCSPTEEEAERIGRAVVEERLAACVNIIVPIRSIYRWEGAVPDRRGSRRALQDRSIRQADALIERVIPRLHSYDVPCVVCWQADKVLREYAEWVEDSVG